MQSLKLKSRSTSVRSPGIAELLCFRVTSICSFRWWRDRERVEATGVDGKAEIFAKYISEVGLDFVPLEESQWRVPTSRPRQTGRVGTQIDYMLCLGLRRGASEIYTDSFEAIGSDHECISAVFTLTTPRVFPRRNTGPREWIGYDGVITHMDQRVVEKLAKRCTRPRRSAAYRDPPEVKQALRQAKVSKTGVAWKHALSLRRKARKVWEANRLQQASTGDWAALRACRPKKNAGWDIAFAAAQQGDPHEAVHKHLSSVYQGVAPVAEEYRYTGKSMPSPWRR